MTAYPGIVRKHWFTYVPYALLCACGFMVLFTHWLTVGAVLIAFSGWQLLVLKSVSWALDDSGIYIKRGVLPWRRTYMHIPFYQVYESFVSFGMFGHFLNFGSITLRRTDGVSSSFMETGLGGVKEFSALINQRLQGTYR